LLEHLAPLQGRISAVLVTTPQAVALLDVVKCISFTRNVSLPVLGLIENMSGFICPCCGEVSNVFSTGGGQALAEMENIVFLGALPVDTELGSLLDNTLTPDVAVANGQVSNDFNLLTKYKHTPSYAIMRNIALSIIARLTEGQ
jgi:NUBPL iron-transfer P-loop NTPase